MDVNAIYGLKEFDIDKELFLTLIQDEARRAISDIVNSNDATLEYYKGRLSELRILVMKATKNRVSINNLGEFTGTDATDWN